MKNLLGYVRVSNEDQSHFSVPGQIEQIEDFARRNNYNLVHTFVDDGQSAKSFDRKSWRKLEEFLKVNHKSIDYLIVFKYDRFSRNLNQALEVIHRLEDIYKIRIISIQEEIGLPVDSPFYFQMRTQMLLQAHVERLIIKERTKFGMAKAKKEGRYMGKAPFGYVNTRDSQNKPLLKVVPKEAELVEKIFEWYSFGITAAEIHRKARALGFAQTGKDSIHRVLRNPVYCGLLKSPDGDGFIEAVHEPIVSRDVFYSIQSISARPELPKRKYNDTAYLKSAIHCHICGKPMTCSKSKGRRRHYWYYECAVHRKSFSVEKAHDMFDNILDELSFTDDQLMYMEKNLKQLLESHIRKTEGSLPLLIAKRSEIHLKKEALEEKYISGKLDDETFANWTMKLKVQLNEIDTEIKSININKDLYWSKFASQIENLKSIKSIFHQATTPQKSAFAQTGFGKTLQYDGNIYRTAFLNPIFQNKSLILRRKELLEVYKKTEIQTESPLWVPHAPLTEHFYALFDWFESVKTA